MSRLALLVLCLFVAGFAVGCGDDNVNPLAPSAAAPADSATGMPASSGGAAQPAMSDQALLDGVDVRQVAPPRSPAQCRALADADLRAALQCMLDRKTADGDTAAMARWEAALKAIDCQPDGMTLAEAQELAGRGIPNSPLFQKVAEAIQACDDAPVIVTQQSDSVATSIQVRLPGGAASGSVSVNEGGSFEIVLTRAAGETVNTLSFTGSGRDKFVKGSASCLSALGFGNYGVFPGCNSNWTNDQLVLTFDYPNDNMAGADITITIGGGLASRNGTSKTGSAGTVTVMGVDAGVALPTSFQVRPTGGSWGSAATIQEGGWLDVRVTRSAEQSIEGIGLIPSSGISQWTVEYPADAPTGCEPSVGSTVGFNIKPACWETDVFAFRVRAPDNRLATGGDSFTFVARVVTRGGITVYPEPLARIPVTVTDDETKEFKVCNENTNTCASNGETLAGREGDSIYWSINYPFDTLTITPIVGGVRNFGDLTLESWTSGRTTPMVDYLQFGPAAVQELVKDDNIVAQDRQFEIAASVFDGVKFDTRGVTMDYAEDDVSTVTFYTNCRVSGGRCTGGEKLHQIEWGKKVIGSVPISAGSTEIGVATSIEVRSPAETNFPLTALIDHCKVDGRTAEKVTGDSRVRLHILDHKARSDALTCQDFIDLDPNK